LNCREYAAELTVITIPMLDKLMQAAVVSLGILLGHAVASIVFHIAGI
jgi:hypothetical protein